MRARNIKPGFCKNEDLAECDVWARLCFALLPMMADRDGRLEDRPKKIKGELFPFDSIEVEPLLVQLETWGMVARYTVDGVALIQILAFAKHQNPHHREQPSTLPPPPSLRLDADGKYVKPEALPPCNGEEAEALGSCDPPQASDKPRKNTPKSDLPRGSSRADSGFLIPDSNPLPPCGGSGPLSRPPLPPWVPAAEWGDFVAMRKAKGKRAPFTDAAQAVILRELAKLREQGHDPGRVLQASIASGWSGVFPLKAAAKPIRDPADIYGEGL